MHDNGIPDVWFMEAISKCIGECLFVNNHLASFHYYVDNPMTDSRKRSWSLKKKTNTRKEQRRDSERKKWTRWKRRMLSRSSFLDALDADVNKNSTLGIRGRVRSITNKNLRKANVTGRRNGFLVRCIESSADLIIYSECPRVGNRIIRLSRNHSFTLEST